jgi:hypothetical protein
LIPFRDHQLVAGSKLDQGGFQLGAAGRVLARCGIGKSLDAPVLFQRLELTGRSCCAVLIRAYPIRLLGAQFETPL